MELEEYIQKMMEEMANQPKEELGKRQPGERNSYELQRIRNYEERQKDIETLDRILKK